MRHTTPADTRVGFYCSLVTYLVDRFDLILLGSGDAPLVLDWIILVGFSVVVTLMACALQRAIPPRHCNSAEL
ncbi:MAG: hypothetical protein ACXV2B_07950 [Halobacteriota archaeon]